MSYFSIFDFIKSGEKSLHDKNYWSALSVALTLPSMCARVMFYSDDYKSIDKNDMNGYWYMTNKGERRWHDKKCYVDFCKEIMRVNQTHLNPKGEYDYWIITTFGSNFGDLLYQLRCDIIHAGIANIYDDDKGIYLALGDLATGTEFSKYRMISIKDLCETIFDHVRLWCSSHSMKNFKYTYVFDMDNSSDDRLLYNRLLNDDRSETLKEQFLKEQNKTE